MGMEMVFYLAGGLGMFLFGMQMMGDGLQKAAGDRLRKILEFLTKNIFMAVLVGIAVTAIIQSSSATTVIVIGFINGGLLTLAQAVGVIMGAAIGTTITPQIIAFKLTDYALPAIALGMGLKLFSSKKQYQNIGTIIVGFGILFLGMKFMSDAMKPLRSSEVFRNAMIQFSENPFLGVATGTIITAVVQSSSATTGILQAIAEVGLINLQAAIPVLFGNNIGTTATALIASIGTTVGARRAAVFHLLFKVLGTLFFLPFVVIFSKFIAASSPNVVRQIANAHTVFNVVAVAIMLPFVNLIVRWVERLVPGEEVIVRGGLVFVDPRLQLVPTIALAQASKELARMTEFARTTLKYAMEGLVFRDEQKLALAQRNEDVVNELEHDITDYLLKQSQASLTEEQSERVGGLMFITNDIERVADLAINIMELGQIMIDSNVYFSELAIQELNELNETVSESIYKVGIALEFDDFRLVDDILNTEKIVNEMELKLKNNHMKRLNQGICSIEAGVLFLDVISNFERIHDHVANYADVARGNVN